MPSLREEFGLRLKTLRIKRNLTQEEFAEATRMSVEFLSMVERGLRAPSFDAIERIAAALRVEVGSLFDFKSAEPTTRSRSKRRRGPTK